MNKIIIFLLYESCETLKICSIQLKYCFLKLVWVSPGLVTTANFRLRIKGWVQRYVALSAKISQAYIMQPGAAVKCKSEWCVQSVSAEIIDIWKKIC